MVYTLIPLYPYTLKLRYLCTWYIPYEINPNPNPNSMPNPNPNSNSKPKPNPIWVYTVEINSMKSTPMIVYTVIYAVICSMKSTPMIVYTVIYGVICSMKSHPYDCLYCHIRSDMQYEVTPL